ncbi:MAG: RNA polymerase sigma factor [Planctomycetota bacterium]
MDTPSAHRIEELLVHGAWLRRLASSLVDDGEADELVQETWLAALLRGPAHRDQGRAWLAQVLRNKATSGARALGARRQREHRSAHPESLPSAAVLASRADLSRRLVELVLLLPADSQRILLARYFEGLSSAEIARRLGRPAGSVRSQLKRGLDELRARLDAESEGERERWLAALTPLAAPGGAVGTGGALGLVLAASAGARFLVGFALAVLVAGAWLMTRGPGPDAPQAPATPLVSEPDVELELDAGEPDALEAVSDAPDARVALAGAPAVPRSPIEGEAVHPGTGEPVVWFELGIVPSDLAEPFHAEVTSDTELPDLSGVELVRTDEAGRFVSERAYESGSFELVPIEDWRFAHPRMEPFRITQPREPLAVEHDAEEPEAHTYELETGAVFAIDCPKALELGADNVMAIYSYLDHFPPGYFRPAPLQLEPVPFVRMRTDHASTHASQVNNLRLVSLDGFWSGSIPMELPESIATQFVAFELEARALVEIDLDFGPRRPPFVVELQYWQGAVDPTAAETPEPDIIELQAKFDGTDLEQAIVKYVRTGLVTIGLKANTCEYWFRVVDLVPGLNSLEALVLPDPSATGRIEGRVVHMGEGPPEPIVGVRANATLNGEPTFQMQDLEFHEEGAVWVADFTFTHLPVATHTVWFDKGGPATWDPKTFAVEPDRMSVEVNGPPLEFELHTDLVRTSLKIRARDAVTGDKIRDFAVSVFVPGNWLRSREADARAGRVSMKLIGDLEGGIVSLAAEGHIRRDVPLSEAAETSKGLELEVELEPGWGGPVYASHVDTEEPLAGMRVLLDGALAAVTDAEGQAQIAVPSAPERVDFELDGYEVIRQGGWVDREGNVIDVGLDPIRQYLGAVLRERE